AVAEDILGQKLEDIATILSGSGNGKSRLYEDVVAIVERCLFRIALERSHDVKSRAADYLGINRNTFQKKMAKLGMNP
ncbi:MAG: helix-turn-helix domain-containing protein, partial [Syntrophus sp. (in: bacteria)]